MNNVAHATCENVGITFTPDSPEVVASANECREVMDKYLRVFAAPTGRCLKCSRTLGGLLGSVQWSLCWGELVCACGYPGRGYHDPKDEAGEKLFTGVLTCILQYHPDQLVIKTEETHEQSEAIAEG